jgi:hypothetical protein
MSFNSHAPDDATIERRVMSYRVELGRDANTYVRALCAYANTRAILTRRALEVPRPVAGREAVPAAVDPAGRPPAL